MQKISGDKGDFVTDFIGELKNERCGSGLNKTISPNSGVFLDSDGILVIDQCSNGGVPLNPGKP